MTLFRQGDFILHSGKHSDWKIECDALNIHDWGCLAVMLMEKLPPFGSVEGVPRGGLMLAKALESYATTGPTLIVDDVWTTGGSMREHREVFHTRDKHEHWTIGAVIFARNKVDPWVIPLFQM